MASQEHKCLADFVKSTHATLREEARTYGPEIAWARHLNRRDILQKYASSMRELATLHWKQSGSEETNANRCRVEWIKSQCKEYFFHGGLGKYNERENEIRRNVYPNERENTYVETEESVECNKQSNQEPLAIKISLLDVGSCYNPFATEDVFDVTAIDLTGIEGCVQECDFLNVNIGEERILSENGQKVQQLPANAYDVVVFSLLIEYLPCPRQRFQCCQKAYELLKPTGVLVIVTPDSKHVGANASIMKSWRYVLSKLGFMRIKYEKLQHLHCLVFRKCIFKDVAIRWANLQTVPTDNLLYESQESIYIPQDLQNLSKKDDDSVSSNSISYSANELLDGFAELPCELD